MNINCVKCGIPAAFPSAVTEPYTCLTCQSQKAPAEERIKSSFPEMEPSAGHDYVEEVIGCLRVARMQRDDAEERYLKAVDAYKNLRDFANSKGLDTASYLS